MTAQPLDAPRGFVPRAELREGAAPAGAPAGPVDAQAPVPPGHPPLEGAPAQAPALPSGHPPLGGPAPGAASAGRITGTIVLSPGLSVGPADVLYVMAKQGAATLAVRRVDKPAFPFSLEISGSDAMMSGGAFAGPVDLVARLSRTGDAIESEKAIREIVTVLERHVAASPDKPQYRSALAVVNQSLGALLDANHRFVDAEQAFRTAVDLLDNLATSPSDLRDQVWMVNSYGGLARTLVSVCGSLCRPAASPGRWRRSERRAVEPRGSDRARPQI